MRILEPDTVRECRWTKPALAENLGRELTQVTVEASFDVPSAGFIEFRQAPREVAANQLATPATDAQQPGREPHGHVQDSKQRGLEQGFHGKMVPTRGFEPRTY